MESRLIFLVRVFAEGTAGWGEVVSMESPSYSYEAVGTARHVIRDYLAPSLLHGPVTTLAESAGRFGTGARASDGPRRPQLAFVDLVARLRGQLLAEVLEGRSEQVVVGVSLGIQEAIPALLDRVDRHLALRYRRIKLKIKPGWDVDVVGEVRRLHPDILLSVEANGAYALDDLPHLRRFDGHGRRRGFDVAPRPDLP
jgi:o-succinylbenzoate synthase